ncbi:MAG TPA: helix-turn-helix domain-containing GNAT family N-acetyltransferase [Casimicrobiaceae bacterium]|nr:helix-turn-helix domain-containing GNAT family N-acetyltransferase [Casimicrobiaceae bacterium]
MGGVDPGRVAAVRRFNRYYTRRIGVLQEGLLHSSYSLTEVRVLYELAHASGLTARDLARDLGLDAGYLSRILQAFEKRGFITRGTGATDARQRPLALTAEGRRAFVPLDRRSQREVAAMLAPIAESEQARLAGAMSAIERILDGVAEGPFVLRTHRPGDMGWVVQAHGELYFREYGWDERFEGLVTHIAAEFIDKFDASRERCWIAERDGERVGCVFLVRKSAAVAKLRLLIVDPKARGLGLGKQLVGECIRFARECGYRTITLWTQQNLTAARSIYEAAGFTLVEREKHAMFGVPLVGETWELDV